MPVVLRAKGAVDFSTPMAPLPHGFGIPAFPLPLLPFIRWSHAKECGAVPAPHLSVRATR